MSAPPAGSSLDAKPTAETLAVAQVLLRADQEVHAIASGHSMHPTIPDGAVMRIRRADPEGLGIGHVVAVLAGDRLVTHRIVARGRSARARAFLVTRGDGRTVCDLPVPVLAVLGRVSTFRFGDAWRDLAGPPPRRPGWRGPVAAAIDAAISVALEIDVRLATALAWAGRGAGGLRAWRRAGRARPSSGDVWGTRG